MKYVCNRCGYKTDRRSSFSKHIYRKKDCLPRLSNTSLTEITRLFEQGKYVSNVLGNACGSSEPEKCVSNVGLDTGSSNEKTQGSFKCSDCEKTFTHRQGLYKHIKLKRCKHSTSSKIEELVSLVTDLTLKVNEQAEVIGNLSKQLSKQKEHLKRLSRPANPCVYQDSPDADKGYVYLIRPNRVNECVFKIGITRQAIKSYIQNSYQDPEIVKVWHVFKHVACEDDIKQHLRNNKMLMTPLKEWFVYMGDPDDIISTFDKIIDQYQSL